MSTPETHPISKELLEPTAENLEAEFYIACTDLANCEKSDRSKSLILINAILDCYIGLGYLQRSTTCVDQSTAPTLSLQSSE